MQTSRVFKASPHCTASPDGRFIATISSQSIIVRSAPSLSIVQTIKLPPDFSTPVSTLAWAPSSARILVANADQIHVVSIVDSSFRAAIRNPAAGGGKQTLVQFGAYDDEVFACAAFGLKFSIFDLPASKAIEINNPKFYLPSSASRGGRDAVSIHEPRTRRVLRSWFPETVDAHGLAWTPDGKWLLLWEASAHGHKLLLYTPDGQFFRSVGASTIAQVQDADLETGIKCCGLSHDASFCAIGDGGRTVSALHTKTWRDGLKLTHPATVVPKDTLQVWQEQLNTSSQGGASYTFLRANQMVSPPSRSVDGKPSPEVKTGCSSLTFDASSTLLVTRLDDAPTTLWIWDVTAAELRAVLMFHSAVEYQWHPTARELLLVTCQDDKYRGVSFVWDPLSEGPKPVSLGSHLPNGKLTGKPQAAWINGEPEFPVLLLSDAQNGVLVSCADAAQCPTPWHEGAAGDRTLGSVHDIADTVDVSALMADDTSTLDDTFSFKHN
ncbi:hypothetical protein FPSE_11759 [Fusarium pseudograminearum CS3096]|uniref:Uncharacterized protein n=1 Tax=Fusarium pseudograminearum (strain CS3096) TaxID=1028729 RepID=K3V7X0_FUSPC|nr:hypothetical protein FPSE_11759 [Fusarium pseudograminearum CS3096]EKJ67948.1 hypothetical protein FPSE_11759 [Fusarium pseudograminearum CS3096]